MSLRPSPPGIPRVCLRPVHVWFHPYDVPFTYPCRDPQFNNVYSNRRLYSLWSGKLASMYIAFHCYSWQGQKLISHFGLKFLDAKIVAQLLHILLVLDWWHWSGNSLYQLIVADEQLLNTNATVSQLELHLCGIYLTHIRAQQAANRNALDHMGFLHPTASFSVSMMSLCSILHTGAAFCLP